MYEAQLSSIEVGIFISHSWAHSGHYDTIAKWFFEEPWNYSGRPIDFIDLSVPKNNPIHFANNAQELYAAISAKISLCNAVIIPTGMYSTHSNWIAKEIRAAKALGKPILAVNPWAQERKSSVVIENSDRAVGWNKQNVVNSTWQLAING